VVFKLERWDDSLVSTDVVGIESTEDDTESEQVVPLVEGSSDYFSHFLSSKVFEGEDWVKGWGDEDDTSRADFLYMHSIAPSGLFRLISLDWLKTMNV
jgi:hypothetical protein